MKSSLLATCLLAFCMCPLSAIAQEGSDLPLPPSNLQDFNADGFITVLAFGDSLTRGTGDFIAPFQLIEDVTQPSPGQEAGYPLRTEAFLNLQVTNAGIPGEELVSDGVERFARAIPSERPDLVVIGGGANDAIFRVNSGTYFFSVQTMINIARAVDALPVLTTIPTLCCDHNGIRPYTDQYNDKMRALASANNLPLADINQGYLNTCDSQACYLLNLPEGLHPNIRGYDVIGEIVTASLLGIDLLAAEGKALLAQALNIPVDDILTEPTAVAAP